MTITKNIIYVGVNDTKIDLFEGQYKVPSGMSYNSYAIIDEKIAIMDSVDANFTEEWLSNIKNVLGERTPDFLIVQHMEPDHSANIVNFLTVYPKAKIVSSAKAFSVMKNFFGTDFEDNRIVVTENDTLCLGEHTLTFITAPMVHWPEVIMTYDSTDKVLFSADAFGKFGTTGTDEDWKNEARRYFIGIVGKYGIQVQNVLKKVSKLDVRTICALHGPILNENIEKYVNLYDTWSSYKPEEDGVVIAYTSVYGNTKKAVLLLEKEMKEKGAQNVVTYDLARCDMAQAVSDAFRYNKTVLATTTYNAEIFPFMREFITHLTERNFSNRTVALIENGSWAPLAAKVMRSMLEKSKNITFTETTVTILSALSEESIAQLTALSDELLTKNTDKEVSCEKSDKKKSYRCTICGYVYEGDNLPADFVCPWCKRGAEEFEEIE
ncbi:MAG: FprA family A-type flavoprotein [Clostridia bacterium]|nr:FprA family A-type flavoprotein [Clostridia bacterium]